MKMLINEIRRLSVRYKEHYIQYSLISVGMIALFWFGIYYRISSEEITMYDRMLVFSMLYYLVVIRLVASGFSNIYNEVSSEFTESKLVYNVTISGYGSYLIILARTFIRSMVSVIITYVSVVCITILLGVTCSYLNYFQVFIQLIIGSTMLFGLGFGFCGLCNLFEIEKQIALILEFALIILMVIAPLEMEYIPINFVKSNIYGILYDDIMLNEITSFFSYSNLWTLIVTFVVLFVGIYLYVFTGYLKLKRKWKIYEG